MSLAVPSQNALSIVYQAVDSLKPRSTNPRTHSKKQIGQIASAIRRFGFTNPVLVDDANGIVAGHGRVEAAKAVGLDQVPTVRLSAMSDAEIRAYVIADNRLAENAGWDRELLGLELQYLTDLDVDFDVTLTGFELPEIDILIGELSPDGDNDPADAVVEVAAGPPVTQPGNLWRIGSHRLICGSCSPIRPTTCRLPGTSAALARSSTANLRWHRGRCCRPNSQRSCRPCLAISRPTLSKVRSIFSAWTGAICRKC